MRTLIFQFNSADSPGDHLNSNSSCGLLRGFGQIRAAMPTLDGFSLDVLGAIGAFLFYGACPGRVLVAEASPD